MRSWANEPRVSRRLRSQLARWNQLNSSLDTIEHTELAVQAYASHNGDLQQGERFLAIYGLLQALVLQQDAVCHLDEALGGPGNAVVRDHGLQEIRSIRNYSVGHPTKADRNDTISHHKIARAELGRGFELVSAFDDGRRQFTYVSLANLMRKQRTGLARIMRKMVKELQQADLRKPVVLKRRAAHRAHKSARHAHQPKAQPQRSATRVHAAGKNSREDDGQRKAPAFRVEKHLAPVVPPKQKNDRRKKMVARPRELERRKSMRRRTGPPAMMQPQDLRPIEPRA